MKSKYLFAGLLIVPLAFLGLHSIKNIRLLLSGNIDTIYKKVETRSGLPLRLTIPKIKVDSKVESVGLTTEGAMDVPSGPIDVAWLNLGARPGDNGSAIISGHHGWKNGQSAVFDNLDKLRIGDKIYTQDSNGKTTTFVVVRSKIYSPEAFAPEVFQSANGIHLNLVSCTGEWDKSTKSSNKRLVVFTDIVN